MIRVCKKCGVGDKIKKGFGVNQNPLVSLSFSSPALPGSDSGSIFSDSLKTTPAKES